MTSSRDDQDTGQVREDILREHRELMSLIAGLSERAGRGAESGESWSDGLSETLTELRTALHQHFVAEEEGPFAQEFPLSFPRLAERLEDVLSEHRDLMERVDSLLREVSEASEHATADEIRTIRKNIRGFIEAIRAHESAENDLLQQAYLDDLGGRG